MSSFSDYLENAALSDVFRGVTLPSPAQVYLALYTAAPTDAGGGTEAAGNGYARQVRVCDGAVIGHGVTIHRDHSAEIRLSRSSPGRVNRQRCSWRQADPHHFTVTEGF